MDCRISKLEIPSTVAIIEEGAFRSNKDLKKVTIYNNDDCLNVHPKAFDEDTKVEYVKGVASKLLGK